VREQQVYNGVPRGVNDNSDANRGVNDNSDRKPENMYVSRSGRQIFRVG
jgi:hypothetical protein